MPANKNSGCRGVALLVHGSATQANRIFVRQSNTIAVLIKFEILVFTPQVPLTKGGNGLIVPLEIQGVSVSVLIEMTILL